jgi:uncharacterized membrane protein (UPF0127 family)
VKCRFTLVALGAAVGLVGCGNPSPGSPATNPPTATPPPPATNAHAASASPSHPNVEPTYHLDHAQPKLATTKLWIGPKEMDAEVARTLTQISTGLMFRPGIGTNDGMLFIFSRPHQPAFYMKNVDFEIAAAYIDSEGVVQEIVKLKAQDPTPVPSKFSNIQFVLETAPDWWERNNLGPGTLVRTDKLTLREHFLGR